MRTGQPDRLEYTALGDRMILLLGMRFALAAIVVAWSAWRPEVLGMTPAALGAIAVSYLALSAAGELARRRFVRRGLLVLSLTLLVDGVFLASAMYATGGTQSPIRFLIYLHLVAVSLLASYRTGLKIALWHSLLLFVVLYAQAAQLLPPVDVVPGRAIEFDRMPVLNVTSFWLFALATSVFSAMNERELRNRRIDLQSLVDISSRLDSVTDPVLQSRLLLDGLADRFGFERGLVLGATDGQAIVLAAKNLALFEGIDACLEGAATLAGLRRLYDDGSIRSDDRVVLVNTGAARGAAAPGTREPRVRTAAEAVERLELTRAS